MNSDPQKPQKTNPSLTSADDKNRTTQLGETQVGDDASDRRNDRVPSGTIGKFELRRQLGSGGMGAVFLAYDPLIERLVAIKVLSRQLSNNATSLKRFLGEARSVGKLNHRNVIAIYDVGEDSGDHYLVMELAEGGNAGELLRSTPRLQTVEACRIALEAAHGLKAAHDIGLIHRDIKPENLMLSKDGVIKLVDFGLSKYVDKESDLGLTRSGQVLGTPIYMSPEQIKSESLDTRTDIYSLGATFFHLLTGELPFTANSYANLVFAHLQSERPNPLESVPTAPPICRRIVAKSMAIDSSERYATIDEMIQDLQVALDAAVSQPREEATPTATVTAPRVLIAEPSKLGGRVLADVFSKTGCTDVRLTSSPDETVREAVSTPSDVIVLAKSLVESGELLERLRESSHDIGLYVIMTSDSPHELMERAPTGAKSVYLSRRAKPTELLRAMHAVTDHDVPNPPPPNPVHDVNVTLITADQSTLSSISDWLVELGIQNVVVRSKGPAFQSASELPELTIHVDDRPHDPEKLRRLGDELSSSAAFAAVQVVDGVLHLRSVIRHSFGANCDCRFDKSRLLRLLESC